MQGVAVVTGMIATYPVGGVAWDYGQYALGLERLGLDVYYLEDTGLPTYTYDPSISGFVEDPTQGVEFLRDSLTRLSPTLGRRWHYRAYDGSSHGMAAGEIERLVADADVLVNVSGSAMLREPYRRCRRKVLIDTDPGWNHFVVFPRWDAKPADVRELGYRSHDHFFTYATRLGRADCPLEKFGLDWRPTRPPVVLDCWTPRPPGERWTTVMMWNNYGEPIEHRGISYGSKEVEFSRVEDLPRLTTASLEITVNFGPARNDPIADRWRSKGWSVREVSQDAQSIGDYGQYVQASRGEFSVAKNIYVATRCGWFSCRTACYLAAGRPAVVQETGFSEHIPTGRGLVSFTTDADAARAIDAIESDYGAHASAARRLAEDEFAAEKVLGQLLSDVGMG